jgi:hypothetical protein
MDVGCHDACLDVCGLQVKPILGGSVKVGYFAVVTDPEGVGTVDHVYADIWHPDGEFKYQIEYFPVGDCEYDLTLALAIWDEVEMMHPDVIKINDVWAQTLPPGMDPFYDIRHELEQGLAQLYYGEALISYCQPGGWYYVGARAHDTFGAWCDYLYNYFWYIPTSAIEVDFNTLNYGTTIICENKWIGGDQDMMTADKPTVRNIGNTPVELFVWQDDMQFGQTDGSWNVLFDARLTAAGDVVNYEPFETTPGKAGVCIPGILELCTKDKLDFSIHVLKGYPSYTYEGDMRLFAYIHDGGAYPWDTPIPFVGAAPLGVEQAYPGPEHPGPPNGCP